MPTSNHVQMLKHQVCLSR